MPHAVLSGVDNDTQRVDTIQLGAVDNVDAITNPSAIRTYYFDEFESRRQTYIGP